MAKFTREELLLEALKRAEARESIQKFCAYTHPDLPLAEHHLLITRALELCEARKIRKLMINCPPGSAKSHYGSMIFPAWYLGRNPTHRLIAASHTKSVAEIFGRNSRNLVGSDEYKMVFETQLAADSNAAGRWDTTKGGGYFAAGVDGGITGRRADILIIDDPVRSREDADSERVREKAWQWYLNDALTRLKPGGIQVVIMTRWHEDDLGGRILEREGDEWHVLTLKMEAGENDILGRKPGQYLWPEYFDEEMILRAKADPRSWSALYQQEPRPVGGGEFKRDWIAYYGKVRHGEMNKVMLVDSSSGGGSDYTCIWVIGIGADDNYYVLDVVRDKLNLTARVDTVMQLHRKWKPRQVRYEKYGMMADTEALRAEMGRQSYNFKVTEVGGALKKEDRIRRLIPIFEQGRIYFPIELHYTDSSGITTDLILHFINSEMLAFPVSKFDDMMDSLARLVEPTIALPQPMLDDRWVAQARDVQVFDATMGF
jgi:predicted phage terminase large subunit-like protein